MAARLRRGDKVTVIAGGDRGSEGQVLRLDKSKGMVIVEGVNVVRRHQKPNQLNQQGGIIEKEMPIDISNVMLVDPKEGGPTRIRTGEGKDGEKVRIAVKSGAVL